jgi:hypothetical protein
MGYNTNVTGESLQVLDSDIIVKMICAKQFIDNSFIVISDFFHVFCIFFKVFKAYNCRSKIRGREKGEKNGKEGILK